jgi:hypothetical protein
MAEVDIRGVQKRHEDWLLTLPNVVSVGIGERRGRSVIQVGVSRKVPDSELKPEEVIPKSLDGVDVDVQDMGEVTAGAAG